MQHIIPLAAEEIEKKILNIPDHWGEVAEDTFNPESIHAQSGLAVAQAISNTLQFTEQELDADQQTQARANIDAASNKELDNLNNQLGTLNDKFINYELSADASEKLAEAKEYANDLMEVESITVQLGKDGVIGGYKTGDVITAGTSIKTILAKLLQKAIPATYSKPTVDIANNGGTASGNIEAGSTVTPKLRATFKKEDAGALTSIKILKDTEEGTTEVATGTTTPLDYTSSDIVIGDETITFTATATYGDAPVKNNNLGEESKENWFAGGSVTSSAYSITGKRQLFYGTGAGSLPTITSSVVRGLSGKKLAPTNGYSFKINVAVGQQYIIIAYPSSLRDVNNITYVEANDSGMASSFTKSTLQVADARGGENGPTSYKVYTYAMTVPAAAAMTFKVTI